MFGMHDHHNLKCMHKLVLVCLDRINIRCQRMDGLRLDMELLALWNLGFGEAAWGAPQQGRECFWTTSTRVQKHGRPCRAYPEKHAWHLSINSL